MARLARALEGRVYVAVCRGLWDYTAKEVFDYVEGLQEGKENKVVSFVYIGFSAGRLLLSLKHNS